MGGDDEEGRLGVVRDLQDASVGRTHSRGVGASVPGHTTASPTGVDQYGQGGDTESGGQKAEQGGLKLGTGTAGAAEGGDTDRCTQEVDDEEVDGNMRCSSDQSRSAGEGTEAQQDGGCNHAGCTCAQPVRDVIVDLCAGRQSMKRPARQMGYMYIAVEPKAVIGSVSLGNQKAAGCGDGPDRGPTSIAVDLLINLQGGGEKKHGGMRTPFW